MKQQGNIWHYLKIIVISFGVMPAAALIGFVVFFNLRYGHYHMEWVDDDGKGNGSLRKIVTAHGNMEYRFSDLSNTNGVYVLEIVQIGDLKMRTADSPPIMSVTAAKFDTKGRLLCQETQALARTLESNSYPKAALQILFAPQKNGESLELVFDIQSGEVNYKCNVHMTAEKIWCAPSV